MDCLLGTLIIVCFLFADDIAYLIRKFSDWAFDRGTIPIWSKRPMSFGGTITDMQSTFDGDAWVRVRDKNGVYRTLILEIVDLDGQISVGDNLWWESDGHAFWTSYEDGKIEVKVPIVNPHNPDRPS